MEIHEKQILPENWVSANFAKCLDIQGGSQPPKKFFSDLHKDGYVRLYQIRDLGNKPVPVYVEREKVSKFCFEGDILIGRYGASVGKVFWAKEGAYNVALVKVIFHNEIFDKGFLFNFLRSQNFQQYLTLISKTAQDGFNKTDLSRIPIPLAPFNEQKRIVDKIERLFSNLDEGEALLKQVQKQLATYRQSVLKAAVTGELTKDWREANKDRLESGEALLQRILKSRRENWQGRGKYREAILPDTSDLPNLPNEWLWVSMDQVLLTIEAGKNFRCLERPPKDDEIGIVKISAVTWGVFNEDESKTINDKNVVEHKWLIKKGDFLFSRANTLELVGASVIVREIKRCLCLSDKVLRFVFAQDISEWANIFIKSFLGRSQIERLATGNQLSMRNITQENIKKICIPLCSEIEFQKITELITGLNSQIDALETWCATELARSTTLRQSILKDAFSGKLVPQDPADEPASELLKRIQAQKASMNNPRATKRKTKATA